MIGKSLGERYGLVSLAAEKATMLLGKALNSLGKPIIEVRQQGLVACVVIEATKQAIQLCRHAGLEMKPGGSGVFGLSGSDAGSLIAALTPEQRAWLVAAPGPRETKILLIANGYALVALDVEGTKVTVRAGPSAFSA